MRRELYPPLEGEGRRRRKPRDRGMNALNLTPPRRSLTLASTLPLQGRVGTADAERAPYSAAMRVAGSTASTLAAQNLNSGILPNGSSFGLVSRFAAAST